jgi:Na+-transporting NADH:ubiquinone oxidoreductase subunit D
MRHRHLLTDPIVDNNPITVQILGVCSALAVTRTMWPALVMAIAVTAVLMFSNSAVSLLRNVIPRSVRLILEVTLIASAVIVTDEALKAYTPEISATLSVFVGLIITNCIVLGRAETFALNNSVGASLLDGLGNGIGYGALLIVVAAVRELLGSGSLFGQPVLTSREEGGVFLANQFMALPASAFFIIGLTIWALRSWRTKQIEIPEYSEAQDRV